MANFQQIPTFFPSLTEYFLDDNNDYIEFGFPIFTSGIPPETGGIRHICLIIKNGPNADKIRNFFNRKEEKILQADGTFLDLRDVAIDYWYNIGKPGYEDITFGKELNRELDE